MILEAVTDVTSSAPRRMMWAASVTSPVIWYEGEGYQILDVSAGYLLATELGFGEKLSSTPSVIREHTDTVSAAIEREFARMVTQIPDVERIFIRKDDDFMRIWTVIPDISIEVEDRIYAAQMAFMGKFPGIPCDFSVIFRQDLDLAAVWPVGSQILLSR